MRRTAGLIVLVTVVTAAFGLLGYQQSRAQGDDNGSDEATLCEVDTIHGETLTESRRTILQQVIFAQSGGSRLSDPGILGIRLDVLRGMRQYHETLIDELPECAQETNRQVISTISALSDVFTAHLLQNADPGRFAENRISNAEAYLQEQFARLSELDQQVRFPTGAPE